MRVENSHNPFYPSELRPSELESEKEFAHWFKHPQFFLMEDIERSVSSMDPHTDQRLTNLTDNLYVKWSEILESAGCDVYRWNASSEKSGLLSRTRDVKEKLKEKFKESDVNDKNPYSVIIHPVFLGTLDDEAYRVMEEVTRLEAENRQNQNGSNTRESAPVFFDKDTRDPYLHRLRDSVPEVLWPHVQKAGKIINEFNLDNGKSNFINMIFVDDSDNLYDNLPFHWKQAFNWMMKAKYGSFKVIIVPYRKDSDGQIQLKEKVLSTLEGGMLDGKILGEDEDREMVMQLAVFGSTRPTGKSEERSDFESITKEQWENSIAVRGLKRLGAAMGRHALLSPGMSVSDLVKGKKEQQLRIRSAEFSQQAEGAMFHYDPDTSDGLYVVTSSGKFGAVKTNLENDDLVAVMPHQTDKTKVYTLTVHGVQNKKPSVEAGEFVGPIDEFMKNPSEDMENFTLRVKRVEGGFREIEDGEVINQTDERMLPAIYGVLHLHRDYESEDLPGDGSIIEVSLAHDEVVGCGVDLMEQKSYIAMKKAYKMWEEGGRKAEYAFFRVGRHGLNVFAFPTAVQEGENKGFIDEYAFNTFEKMLDEGKLELLHEVKMDHTTVDPYREIGDKEPIVVLE